MKLYEVWFSPTHPASLVVEASSEYEAQDIAEEELMMMSGEELLRRVTDALDYGGIKVEAVNEIQD